MPELETITIKGFKSIKALEGLELRPINVLVGPNGSGKSNFIGAFAFLNAIRSGRLQDYVGRSGGADNLLHFGSKVTSTISMHISFQGGVNQYEIELSPTKDDALFPSSEMVYFWDKSKYDRPFGREINPIGREAGISRAKTGIGGYVQTHLDSWRLYHFHDTSDGSPMKKTADIKDNRFLRSDGFNLAAFLYLLSKKHAESYGLIRRTVQRVAPFFEDFHLEPQELNENSIRLEWRHRGTDSYFDSSAFSDGTLRFIALATLLLQPKPFRPSVILIDEPELGLHPYAITMLASMIKQAAASTQVIVSTQSPFLLDHFSPEDVLVADHVEGSTRLTRLDPEMLASWLTEYSLGQLWEKNEFGGRPGAR